MKILKAFRYRLEPTEEQARQLSRYRGCMRFVWNKAILDQGWSMFQTLLTYKLTWQGGYLKTVPAPYTSQTCPMPTCGHTSKENRISQADFTCTKCGYHANADTVGAMNVLRVGLTRIACLPA